MAQNAVELGQQGAGPRGALGQLHAEHGFDPQDDTELVGERRQPVVAVGQNHDLTVVAHLEELLGAAVHVSNDRLGADDALTVDHQSQPKHAVSGRVLRADVEHHVGRGEPARAYPDGELSRRGRCGHTGSVPCPPAGAGGADRSAGGVVPGTGDIAPGDAHRRVMSCGREGDDRQTGGLSPSDVIGWVGGW